MSGTNHVRPGREARKARQLGALERLLKVREPDARQTQEIETLRARTRR